MNVAELMREIAFKNKDVKQAYQRAMAIIKESASHGDLFADIDKDETVIELLKKDGFIVSYILQPTNLSPEKVKISW
jgi:hypothetical protein